MSIGLRTGALLCSWLAACGSQTPEVLACSDPQVVYDPYQHIICPDACVDDMDCPRGTLCAKPDEKKAGTCEVGTTELQTSRSALLQGFGVSEMSGELQTDTGLEFVWQRPEGARFVQCALFACAPAFRVLHRDRDPGDPNDDEWLKLVDPTAAEIADYDRCVLAEELSSQPEGAFNLRERDNQYKRPFSDAPLPEKTPTCGTSGKYGCAPINDLLVGCWAYDDTRVVAATRLASVDVRDGMYNYNSIFAADDGNCAGTQHRVCRLADDAEDTTTGGDTEGMTMTASTTAATTDAPRPPADSRYGACDGDTCATTCTRDSDCSGDPPSDTELRVEGWIGYCVEDKCISLQSESTTGT